MSPPSSVHERPVSARSVIASVLLPLGRPELPAHTLVRCGELFGIAPGTSRVAMSRMVSAGELELEDGTYRLTGALLDRRERQEQGRHPRLREFDGRWWVAVVKAEGRSPAQRVALRTGLRRLRMGELREGVWIRPDNLDDWDVQVRRAGLAARQCDWFCASRAAVTGTEGEDDGALAERLWGLLRWAEVTASLQMRLADHMPRLARGETAALAPGFRAAAEVVRHLTSDPLLPPEMLPAGWPGTALRVQYDEYEIAYQRVLRDWLRGREVDRR